MTTKIRFAFCSVCKKEVEKSARKPLTTTQKIVWVIVIIGTLGIAAIAYAIYLSNKPKVYCPNCFNKLEYSDKPFVKPKKKPEDMTPREKVLDKAGKEIEAEETKPVKEKPEGKKERKKEVKVEKEKIFCSFCGEELDEDYPTCPYCQAVRKF
ncbi:MAG: hypothetical protein ACFE91_00485 [Promethearchaeota archaeon]